MPKPAKLAEFFQGHFIRFCDRGQAGNGFYELFGIPGILRWVTRWASFADGTYATYETYGPVSLVL